MRLKKKRFTKKVGFPPGSLIYTGDKKTEPNQINLVKYDENFYESTIISNIESLPSLIDETKTNWLHINSLNHIEIMDSIGKIFDIHPLILEDTLNNEHLPKIEETPNSLYLTLKHITFSESNVDIDTTHLSFILSNNFLITFSETNCDLYNNIRENIQSNKGKIRKNKTDYLFYVLLDAIVDNYYIVFEALIDRIDELEDKLIENKTENLIKEIHQLKKALSSTRKLVYPLTEALNKLIIEQSDFIHDHTQIYIKDVYDHILQLTEIYETCREMLAGLIDLNLSNINNNMNNVMKTLTIISFIFIPLTFIVGLYGMNFKYMPELEYKYSYPILLLFMLTLVLFTIFYIKKKKWF